MNKGAERTRKPGAITPRASKGKLLSHLMHKNKKRALGEGSNRR